MMSARVVALLLVVLAALTFGGGEASRLADALPSRYDVIRALKKAKDMKVSELFNLLSKSDKVKSSLRRAAADLGTQQGVMETVMRLAKDPAIAKAIGVVANEAKDLTLDQIANLRDTGSEELKSSVRAALDALVNDQAVNPVAAHLQKAWVSDDGAESMKHIHRALDAVDDMLEEAENAQNKVAKKKNKNVKAARSLLEKALHYKQKKNN